METIEAKRQSLEEVAIQLADSPKLARSAASLAKKFKPTVVDTLQQASDLARWLYVHEKPELALQVCQVPNYLPFENDYNRWTWVEFTLALEWKLRTESSQLSLAQACVASIQATYAIGTEAERKIKADALKYRLAGGLLRTAIIAEAEQAGDKTSAKAWRFIEVGELLFMQALGGSETWPLPALEHQLAFNLLKLRI